MRYPKHLYRRGGDIFIHRGGGFYTWNDKDLKPRSWAADGAMYPYTDLVKSTLFSTSPMKTPRTRRVKPRAVSTFTIDPKSPDVVTTVPVAYVESRIKRGADWSSTFIRWLKKAPVRGGRYYQLEKTKERAVYFDVATYNIYLVYPTPTPKHSFVENRRDSTLTKATKHTD